MTVKFSFITLGIALGGIIAAALGGTLTLRRVIVSIIFVAFFVIVDIVIDPSRWPRRTACRLTFKYSSQDSENVIYKIPMEQTFGLVRAYLVVKREPRWRRIVVTEKVVNAIDQGRRATMHTARFADTVAGRAKLGQYLFNMYGLTYQG